MNPLMSFKVWAFCITFLTTWKITNMWSFLWQFFIRYSSVSCLEFIIHKCLLFRSLKDLFIIKWSILFTHSSKCVLTNKNSWHLQIFIKCFALIFQYFRQITLPPAAPQHYETVGTRSVPLSVCYQNVLLLLRIVCTVWFFYFLLLLCQS